MRKNLLLIIIVLFSHLICCAQRTNDVTVLYLLPFHLKGTPVRSTFKSSAEIYQVKQFEMMGFWLGAKMALQEYKNSNHKINVIVRDAVTDVQDLNYILEDSVLMKPVNIIIGPFYGSLFPTAAEFAKKHQKIIVNPFSSRYDFVEENPYVYKLTPPFLSRAEAVTELFLSGSEEYDIILWGDTTDTPERVAYQYYFNEHNIAYREGNSLSLSKKSKKNIIIPLFEQRERVIYAVHSLVSYSETNKIVIVPEKWFTISELTEDFYMLPDLYYFTNYFVNENSDEIKQFKSDYINNYGAPADLASFSFQGYDVTRYFIDLFFADFNTNEVKFKPLSYIFNWRKVSNGGFENVKARLIQVKELEQEER